MIYEGQKNYLIYSVLARQDLDRKDADEAIILTTLEQYNESSPLMKIKKSMMTKNSYYYYRVEVRVKASEYDSYSSTIDRIINSFQLNSDSTPLEETSSTPNAFTGTEYVNSEYGFSLQYPTTWVEKTTDLPLNTIKQFGVGAWFFMPSLSVIVVEQPTGATLQEAFVAWQASVSYTPKTFTAIDTTINGVTYTKADVTYTNANGECNGTIIGFTKNDKWLIIEAVALPLIGGDWENPTQKADIIGTIKFQ
jgi:hypothetical protein